MKGINYLASVVKAYREAIDLYISDSGAYSVKPEWQRELALVYHREYCTGFYFNDPDQVLPNYENKHAGIIHSFIGRIIDSPTDKHVIVAIKNKVSVGDNIEILLPSEASLKSKVLNIFDINQKPIKNAQPNSESILKLEISCTSHSIVRKLS